MQRLCAILSALSLSIAVAAQPPRPAADAQPPNLSEAVLQLLEAEHLSEDERRELRLFHGVWLPSDAQSPAARASIALTCGILDDHSLHDPDVPAEDRAEGMLLRGELEEAIAALDGIDSMRAIRLRAAALEALGRFAEAAEAVEPAAQRLASARLGTAPDLVEGARALMIRARVRGQDLESGGDFKVIMAILARARDQLDRLYWPASLAEAELLYEKDNRSDAADAATDVLRLNPRSAAAWALLGEMAVDGFAFDRAQSIDRRLSRIALALDPSEEMNEGLGSAWGDLLLARGMLRNRDADGAESALRPTLQRFPRMRPALALRAAIAAARFDDAGVERLLAEFDRLSPGSPEALLAVGVTLSEARQYDDAARYLARAAARQPRLAAPLIHLGLLEMQAGRDERSIAALEKAAALDPFNVRAGNTLRLARELASYPRLAGEHFEVRYRPGLDSVLAPEMLPVLQRIHERVCGDGPGGIAHAPEGKTLIELMPDHKQFAVRITGMPGIHTIAASTGPVIAMESPQVGPGHSVGVYDWARVVQHEYTHTVTLSRTKNRIPHWFTEAAAVHLEDSPRDYSRCQLLANAFREGELFGLDRINVMFVRPEKPTDRAQAYAQGHWMYEFILERWGNQAPLRLMDRYATGAREDAAFAEVLSVTPDEFMAAFRGWARAQLIAWGVLPRDGQPSLRQLRLREALAGGEADAQTRLDASTLSAAAAAAGLGGVVRSWEAPDVEPDESLIQRWLAQHPDHPDVMELAVDRALEAARGEPSAEMIPLLERYAAARPADEAPHRHLARLYLGGAGDGPAAAIKHLEYLDAREQHSGAYAVELARRYAAEGDWDRAAAKSERATMIAPFKAEYRELAATVALQRQDLDSAERHLLALTRIEPDREVHVRRLEALRKRRASPAP